MAPKMSPIPQNPTQASEKPQPKTRREPKRLSQLHRGVHPVIDAAVEARRDTEHVATEYEARRSDVQDLFAWNTRRLLRKLEGIQRDFDQRLREIDAMLRGERPSRKGVA